VSVFCTFVDRVVKIFFLQIASCYVFLTFNICKHHQHTSVYKHLYMIHGYMVLIDNKFLIGLG
jgi:hypothetical protein